MEISRRCYAPLEIPFYFLGNIECQRMFQKILSFQKIPFVMKYEYEGFQQENNLYPFILIFGPTSWYSCWIVVKKIMNTWLKEREAILLLLLPHLSLLTCKTKFIALPLRHSIRRMPTGSNYFFTCCVWVLP